MSWWWTAGGLPMMKHLSAFGASIWNVALMLLAVAAFVIFWSLIAFGIYIVAKEVGFSEKAALWPAIISTGTMVVLFCLRCTISQEALTTWGLTLLAWALIAAVVLAIGVGVLIIIFNPPSLYSLVVIGLVLLAGILWQLTKLTSKR
jgi:hypothetical protein